MIKRPISTQLVAAPQQGVSPFMLAVLAAVGYAGYRVYRHFKRS